jgi:hypothetical protein
VEQGHGFGSLGLRVKRWEFLAAIPAAFYAFACGQEPPAAGKGGTDAPSGGMSGAGGTAGSGGANASATPGGGTGGAMSGGNGGSASSGGAVASSGAGATGGSNSVGKWKFDCGDPSLPEATGARAGAADFSANSENGATEPHVLYLNGYFLIRRTTQYVTEGEADHQHEILLSDEQIDALILGKSVVVETNGPPLNASSGHGHTITIRSCFIV